MKEIDVILKYIDRIHVDFPSFKLSEMGIISPYRYQTHWIRQRISGKHNKELNKITIDSVERFQGSERKAILLTATRTDRLGFVGCDLVTSVSNLRDLYSILAPQHFYYSSKESSDCCRA